MIAVARGFPHNYGDNRNVQHPLLVDCYTICAPFLSFMYINAGMITKMARMVFSAHASSPDRCQQISFIKRR